MPKLFQLAEDAREECERTRIALKTFRPSNATLDDHPTGRSGSENASRGGERHPRTLAQQSVSAQKRLRILANPPRRCSGILTVDLLRHAVACVHPVSEMSFCDIVFLWECCTVWRETALKSGHVLDLRPCDPPSSRSIARCARALQWHSQHHVTE